MRKTCLGEIGKKKNKIMQVVAKINKKVPNCLQDQETCSNLISCEAANNHTVARL